MSDSPRRTRATGWAWACLALFGGDAESVDAESTDPREDESRDDGASEAGSTTPE
ncbi:hypothetical protein [Halorubrum tebenquichense]|uniref:hypothetical protein n=1 Tax=Halorubrum tebenquichense TaxID=119434 RepID=UPI001375C4A2|nr:hypothetical protein [Halorubrum tebenquichense]